MKLREVMICLLIEEDRCDDELYSFRESKKDKEYNGLNLPNGAPYMKYNPEMIFPTYKKRRIISAG